LDRGEGIPHEGNYGSWLAKKAKRMEDEKKKDERLKRTLDSELNWFVFFFLFFLLYFCGNGNNK